MRRKGTAGYEALGSGISGSSFFKGVEDVVEKHVVAVSSQGDAGVFSEAGECDHLRGESLLECVQNVLGRVGGPGQEFPVADAQVPTGHGDLWHGKEVEVVGTGEENHGTDLARQHTRLVEVPDRICGCGGFVGGFEDVEEEVVGVVDDGAQVFFEPGERTNDRSKVAEERVDHISGGVRCVWLQLLQPPDECLSLPIVAAIFLLETTAGAPVGISPAHSACIGQSSSTKKEEEGEED